MSQLSRDIGEQYMDQALLNKLMAIEPLGYDRAVTSAVFLWDKEKKITVTYFQKPGSDYCLMVTAATAIEAAATVRGFTPAVKFTMEQYREFLKGDHPGLVKVDAKQQPLVWFRILPQLSHVKQFLVDKTTHSFELEERDITNKVEGDNKVITLKNMVATYGPLIVSIYVGYQYNDFKPRKYEHALPVVPEGHILNKIAVHAVLLTGWCFGQVQREVLLPNGMKKIWRKEPCWEVIDTKKSWGTKGRALVAIEDNRLIGIKQCVFVNGFTP